MIRLINIVIYGFWLLNSGYFSQAEECACRIRSTNDPVTQLLTGFEGDSASASGCRAESMNRVKVMAYDIRPKPTPQNKQNQCMGNIHVYIDMQKGFDNNDFMNWIEVKFGTNGIVIDANGKGAARPRMVMDVPRFTFALSEGKSIKPLSVMVNQGPEIRKNNGVVYIDYWQTCGWKASIQKREVTFSYDKDRYEVQLYGICGQCGGGRLSKWFLKDQWQGGIGAVTQPFRLKILVDFYCVTYYLPEQGSEPSTDIPDCSETMNRQLAEDEYCGYIINGGGPFGSCMQDVGGVLTGNLQLQLFNKCKTIYCQQMKKQEKEPRQTLCERLEEVSSHCPDSGWKDTEHFSYCKGAPQC